MMDTRTTKKFNQPFNLDWVPLDSTQTVKGVVRGKEGYGRK